MDPKYESLSKHVSNYRPTEEQSKALVDIQKEHDSKYQSPTELTKGIPIPFSKKYETAQQVFDALKEVKKSQTPFHEARVAQIWANLSESLRKNTDEMIKIVREHPEAVVLAERNPADSTFAVKAVNANRKAYDFLTSQEQNHDRVVAKYCEKTITLVPWTRNDGITILDNNKWTEPSSWGPIDNQTFLAATALDISPNCPKDKFFSPENYEKVFESILRDNPYHGLMNQAQTIEWTIIPNSITYLAMAKSEYPELAEKYAKAEERVIEKNPSIINKQLSQPRKSDLQELLQEPRLAQAFQRGLEKEKAYKEQVAPQQDGKTKFHFFEGQAAFEDPYKKDTTHNQREIDGREH